MQAFGGSATGVIYAAILFSPAGEGLGDARAMVEVPSRAGGGVLAIYVASDQRSIKGDLPPFAYVPFAS